MTLKRLWRPALAAALLSAGQASAASLTFTLGDEDCFGLGGPCADGSDFVSVAPTDRSGPGDPAGTDVFGPNGTLNFSFLVDLGGEVATSATVSARTVGLDLVDLGGFGDAFIGARFLFNGVDIGTFSTGSPLEIATASFAVAPGALMDLAINMLTIVPEEAFEQFQVFEDFAVDFARLSIETQAGPTAAVPLPGALWLLLGGLGALGALRRKAA
ncbi:MAG: VPLPA-CTERM sorting domain-containing protein [Pikeienuella sp.]|uniref:VPLPA-CTERM sorting domain-containing protein n=1 Tax=Pikeienuella sp. TaxID=2831957 RepID=UPI00391D9812